MVCVFSIFAFLSKAQAGLEFFSPNVAASRVGLGLFTPNLAVGSTVQSQGYLNDFSISFDEWSGAVECKFSITGGDGRTFSAEIMSGRDLMEGNPIAGVALFRHSGACLAAQRAFLKGQVISLTGKVEPPANSSSTEPASLSLTRMEIYADTALQSFVTASSVCTPVGCAVEGLVERVDYDLSDGPFLCTATLKMTQSNPPEQRVKVSVGFPRLESDYHAFGEVGARKLMFSKFQICRALEAAGDLNKVVKTFGVRQGADDIALRSMTVEKPASVESSQAQWSVWRSEETR
ncbi:MAG TPA: hypothetical protein DF383_05585 [Deltaproteobacteria bacterium]|nr:hypothetical protein [Deltaproteobacteria bacterium]